MRRFAKDEPLAHFFSAWGPLLPKKTGQSQSTPYAKAFQRLIERFDFNGRMAYS
jgi:hypothetical protein